MSTSVANISQDYIDYLSEQTKSSKNEFDKKSKKYAVKLNESKDVKDWQNKIEEYWKNVEKTEKLAKTTFEDIENLIDQAQKVNNNIENTLEAVKYLVYNMKVVSLSLEDMTNRYQALKTSIDSGSMYDSKFKPSTIMAKFKLLGEKLVAASQAVDAAILKVLELTKAFYLLQTDMDSEDRVHDDWVVDHIIAEFINDGGKLKLIDLYETVEVQCGGERVIKEPGLEWHLKKLDELLRSGMPQPDEDADGYPCQDAVGTRFIPTFPLCESTEGYYNRTKSENEMAKGKTTEAEKGLEKAEKAKRLAESSYKAYKAALDAAEAAKNIKK